MTRPLFPDLGADPIERTATLSADGVYRYRLGRRWSAASACAFLMLNPSTADAEADDPTIRRCVGYARGWGHGALVVVNLFAFRATDPTDLVATLKGRGEAGLGHVVGPENDSHILAVARESVRIVCAWGNHGRLRFRDDAVLRLLHYAGHGDKLCALETTKRGTPCHPLRLRADLQPRPWGVLPGTHTLGGMDA